MSQPPNSQPPSSQPQGQDTQTPQVTSNPGFVKKQSVKVLRGTINALERLVTKLEAEPTTPPTPIWEQLQRGWSRVLATIRNFLPRNISISDTALTGITAGIIFVVGTTAFFLSPKSSPPEVAEAPQILVQKEPKRTIPPIAVPEPSQPIVEPIQEEPKPIPAPSELVAPEPPQAVTEAPSPVPSEVPSEPIIEPMLPVVEPTPEQSLIAAIEKQVAQVSDRYGDGIIQSLQVNFPANSLTVILKTDWYNLEPSQQDKLTVQMFQRAKELDFIYLEVVDPQGNLLARSPVVGENMVILKRQV
ncbi:hypothetical protein [Gloeocapsopsis dulcis]|uniref:Uncharacterized protein n=1 Tax=Gloeocapsopsis dulcis AAB1 = 1H9 TaxID=1433147 RepID=A0A6N8FV48_9CHRO|nr:hypothetical protein [Gloeocapsopsis dulcis]MUL36462.1 hypothetical protein [Gloeocapsopsis dulcis AAB1 = 1H9]WNN87751.1 hypothetical protein P0S91_15675 [Gloeocapsopsis dulcis]